MGILPMRIPSNLAWFLLSGVSLTFAGPTHGQDARATWADQLITLFAGKIGRPNAIPNAVFFPNSSFII
jgi:hypothetical protein